MQISSQLNTKTDNSLEFSKYNMIEIEMKQRITISTKRVDK